MCFILNNIAFYFTHSVFMLFFRSKKTSQKHVNVIFVLICIINVKNNIFSI